MLGDHDARIWVGDASHLLTRAREEIVVHIAITRDLESQVGLGELLRDSDTDDVAP